MFPLIVFFIMGNPKIYKRPKHQGLTTINIYSHHKKRSNHKIGKLCGCSWRTHVSSLDVFHLSMYVYFPCLQV